MAEHPECEPLRLADFGWVDPPQAGIKRLPLPRFELDADGRIVDGDPSQLVPGWYAASVNLVMGYRHYEADRPVYTWLTEFEPVARPGYAYWVYHLTAGDVAAFRERHPVATVADSLR